MWPHDDTARKLPWFKARRHFPFLARKKNVKLEVNAFKRSEGLWLAMRKVEAHFFRGKRGGGGGEQDIHNHSREVKYGAAFPPSLRCLPACVINKNYRRLRGVRHRPRGIFGEIKNKRRYTDH
jgi:hypothetical protein